jgi:hypothetical protein
MDEKLYLDEEAREDYQRYLAITHAAMGDYMGHYPGEGNHPFDCEVCFPRSRDSDATGYVQPIDVEAETVRPIDCSCDNGLYESLTGDWAVCQKCRPSRVGPTPTSPEAETTPWNRQTLEDEAMAAMLAAEKQTLLDCLSTIEQVLNKQSPDVGAALDGCYQIYKHLRGL